MIHPHEALLSELAIAIRHFVPTLPKEVKKEAQDALERFRADTQADEQEIKHVFYEVGLQEYPYRRAYQELTSGEAKARLEAMVLEHVDEAVRGVLKPHLDSGVTLESFVRSALFETELTAEQRYQIEDGLLLSSRKLAEELASRTDVEEDTYEALVKKWSTHAQEIVKAIQTLETLASQGDKTQKEEIAGGVERFREGFLVTEPDPDLEEVKKEIEYWQEVLSKEES